MRVCTARGLYSRDAGASTHSNGMPGSLMAVDIAPIWFCSGARPVPSSSPFTLPLHHPSPVMSLEGAAPAEGGSSISCSETGLPLFVKTTSKSATIKASGRWVSTALVALSTLALLGCQHRGLLDASPAAGPSPPSHRSLTTSLTNFVTRKGDRLMLEDEPFRFVSFNAPDLHVVEDGHWHPITAWEQADTLQTIARMGGRVVRIYPMSIVGGLNNGTYTHVQGKGVYNERLFQDLDRLLVLAREHDVRVILPFIDNWDWWGGIAQFAALYGQPFAKFYDNPEVIKGFHDFVRFIVMRVNSVNGVAYRDDPTILAWETGNELDYDDIKDGVPTSATMEQWTAGLAALLKTLDPNHLVIDGRLLRSRAVSPGALSDPNIDVISDHFYPNLPMGLEERLDHLVAFTRGHKPFIVGEFGLVMPEIMDRFLYKVHNEPSITGALLWSLRSHSHQGGFYWHYEYDSFWAYHYPGFDSNAVDGERDVITLMERHAYGIQGLSVPPPSAPTRPELIAKSTTSSIRWRGAVAAQAYKLERKDTNSTEGWTLVAPKLSDSDNPFKPFDDVTAEPGRAYVYRITAFNAAGPSAPSDPLRIGPPAEPSLRY